MIDFSSFSFEKTAVREWGEYVLSGCQQVRLGVADNFNSLIWVLNKSNGAWDLMENPISVFGEYNGTLIGGDSLTPNVFTLFSGFDDDGEPIANYWTSGQTDLGMMGLKRFTRFAIEGLIQASQRFKISLSFDGGDFVDVAYVDGAASYVDAGASIAVGTNTIGAQSVGGAETVFAKPYRVEFNVQSPKFRYVRVRFEAAVLPENAEELEEPQPGGGYVSIHSYAFKDIRQKSLRSLPERTN